MITAYQQLEKRIKANDLDGLIARWEFGMQLLAEQDAQGKLPPGFMDELSNALDVSRAELYCRLQFAKERPTRESVEDALRRWKSWYVICAKGLGRRGRNPLRLPMEEPASDLHSIGHKAYLRVKKDAERFLVKGGPLESAVEDVLWEDPILAADTAINVVRVYDLETLLRTLVELNYRVERCTKAIRRKLDDGQATVRNPGPTLLDRVKGTAHRPVKPQAHVTKSRNRRLEVVSGSR